MFSKCKLIGCIKHTNCCHLTIFVISWVFATLFLTASLAGSDFCYNPDEVVQAYLNSKESGFDGIIFGFIIFYISVSALLFCAAEI